MPLAYRVKSLADLAQDFRGRAKKLRDTAPDLRMKRNKDRSEIEAGVFDEVADILEHTTIEP
jgi:hypothetical protein